MEGSLRQINLSDIDDPVGTPASSTLIGSIRRNGVVQPIVLAELPDENGELRLKLIDGNRRVKAARASGLSSIPAIVLTNVERDTLPTLSLVLNGFRTANYLTEFWAIKQLERLGASEKDILSISGLSRTMVKRRTQLSGLNRELFVALRNGRIYQTHAAEIAKLPNNVQSELTETFRKKKRLQQSDIDVYRPPKSRKSETPSIADSLQTLAWSAQESRLPSEYGHQTVTRNPPVLVDHPQNSPNKLHASAPTENSTESPSIAADMESTQPNTEQTNPLIDQSVHPSPAGNEQLLDSLETAKPSTPGATKPGVDLFADLPKSTSEHAQGTFQPINSENPVNKPFNPIAATEPDRVSGFSERATAKTPAPANYSSASRAVMHMRNAVIAAQLLDFDKAEFLEMAARIWDETISQQTEQQLMRNQTPKEPFPDLAAHKWDTGES